MMGWLSKITGAVSVAKNVWAATKRVVAEAVVCMADNAEQFIGDVKKDFQYVRRVCDLVSKHAPWPWLRKAATVFNRALTWIERIEETPLGKKLKAAFDWTVKIAQEIRSTTLSGAELVEARERDMLLSQAETKMPPEERKAATLARLINLFVMTQSRIKQVLSDASAIRDFEHYLRLRATQKLLELSEKTLTESQDAGSIGNDDVFLIHIAQELLLADPAIKDTDLERLNALIYSRYQKELIPLVFEEMINTWAHELVDKERLWTKGNKELAEKTVRLGTLENRLKHDIALSSEEQADLQSLRSAVPVLESTQKELSAENYYKRNYVYAAEGFLEILEGNAYLDGKEYLAEQGNQVGMIIIDCAQHGKKWEMLSEDEQELVEDFANIFKQKSQERNENFENEMRMVEVAA